MVISPFSVAMSLGLLSQAAKRGSFNELQRGLRLNANKATIAHQFHKYFNLTQKNAGASNLLIASRIYVQQEHQTIYRDLATEKFFASVESVDFKNATETAATINRFVKDKTMNRITEIVKPNMFNNSSRSVEVNAIYFKSKWLYPIQSNQRHPFKINGTEDIMVGLMVAQDQFKFADVPELDARALQLYYGNPKFSFVIILPNQATGLHALEMQLNCNHLPQIMDRMKFGFIRIGIPKFKIESGIVLNDILKKASEHFTKLQLSKNGN